MMERSRVAALGERSNGGREACCETLRMWYSGPLFDGEFDSPKVEELAMSTMSNMPPSMPNMPPMGVKPHRGTLILVLGIL
jgi:hypothetical protein